MNFAHSKTNSLLNFVCRLSEWFSSQLSMASGPKVCGILVYKFTTSNVTSKVSSKFSLEYFDKKSRLSLT